MVNFAVAQTAEPIVSQFRGRARVAHETVHQFGGGAHWRQLANMIERSMRHGDATLRQITLTD